VFIEGAVLAPFTFGGSLVVAGWIAAAFALEELYRAVEEHKQAEALASTEMRRELLPMELEAVEIALWTQPSRVELVRMVTSKTIDAGLNLVPANQIKFLTSLAVMAVSMALAPAERKTLSQQDLAKRAKSAQQAAQAKAVR
jgi:hypothetical protein